LAIAIAGVETIVIKAKFVMTLPMEGSSDRLRLLRPQKSRRLRNAASIPLRGLFAIGENKYSEGVAKKTQLSFSQMTILAK
jgi:hypothetical protein